MTQTNLSAFAIRVADLPSNTVRTFDVVPDAKLMSQMCADLDLLELRKARLNGQLEPVGKRDWRLTAKLGATVTQPCVATLEPVQTRIDEAVERVFLSNFDEPDDPETEMPEDDGIEPLREFIDPLNVLHEALSLALPLYPRAEAANPVEIRITEPGKTAMTDDEAKPFAGLAALKSSLPPSNDG